MATAPRFLTFDSILIPGNRDARNQAQELASPPIAQASQEKLSSESKKYIKDIDKMLGLVSQLRTASPDRQTSILNEFKSYPTEIKNTVFEALWIARGRPVGIDNFGELSFFDQDPRCQSTTMQKLFAVAMIFPILAMQKAFEKKELALAYALFNVIPEFAQNSICNYHWEQMGKPTPNSENESLRKIAHPDFGRVSFLGLESRCDAAPSEKIKTLTTFLAQLEAAQKDIDDTVEKWNQFAPLTGVTIEDQQRDTLFPLALKIVPRFMKNIPVTAPNPSRYFLEDERSEYIKTYPCLRFFLMQLLTPSSPQPKTPSLAPIFNNVKWPVIKPTLPPNYSHLSGQEQDNILISMNGRELTIISDEKTVSDKLKTRWNEAQDAMNKERNYGFVYRQLNSPNWYGNLKFEKGKITFGDYQAGFCGFQGKRYSMEDAHDAGFFKIEIQGITYPVHYVFVADGHGGDSVSAWFKLHFERMLLNTLTDFNSNGFTRVGIWNALKQTFVRLNDELAEHPSQIGENKGTTACAVLILNGKIYCFNAGDSRATLDNNDKPVQLSDDAKPHVARFEQKIEHRGGWVSRQDHNGKMISRVIGNLSTSGAIGDLGLGPFISARPGVVEMDLASVEPNSHLFLACDGVWDVCSTKEAVRIIHFHAPSRTLEQMAEEMVYSAYRNGSTDNLTAVVVKLK